jgi:hypothetical protein
LWLETGGARALLAERIVALRIHQSVSKPRLCFGL